MRHENKQSWKKPDTPADIVTGRCQHDTQLGGGIQQEADCIKCTTCKDDRLSDILPFLLDKVGMNMLWRQKTNDTSTRTCTCNDQLHNLVTDKVARGVDSIGRSIWSKVLKCLSRFSENFLPEYHLLLLLY